MQNSQNSEFYMYHSQNIWHLHKKNQVLHLFFLVSFGTSSVEVDGSWGGVAGVVEVWGEHVMTGVVTRVDSSASHFLLLSLVSSFVLSLPGQAQILKSRAFLPSTCPLKCEEIERMKRRKKCSIHRICCRQGKSKKWTLTLHEMQFIKYCFLPIYPVPHSRHKLEVVDP